MKKYFLILALFASACITSQAGTKKKSKKDKKAEVAKVDTIDVKTFSYLIGRLTTEGLAQYIQQQGVDLQYMSYFLEGFKQGKLTEADAQAKARITGAEIRQDVDTRVIPNLAKQINDSTTQLSSEEFVRGFMEAMQGVQSEISTDSAKILVDKQMEYYQTTQMERRYGANRKAGEDFLKANAKNKDITQTASGLQYKVITKGEGS
ncbi:MAG: FKBP-type peptidyl-prolyl cis-trans isomerase N-terminal domain-containing protein, partial [Bacteroidaceae bacterium]|nr:FKBP-type peptidyl-prolyl cis-trans isomerase N-terminal domain-containing protein [Bacteroidaceae bacterium]